MRVDVCEDEVDACFSILFTCTIKLYKLDVVRGSLVLAPGRIATESVIDIALDEGSGTTATGAEVDEGVGLEGRAEKRAKPCRKERCARASLNDWDFQCPEYCESCLDSFAEEGWEPVVIRGSVKYASKSYGMDHYQD